MVGAGGIKMANYLFAQAARDGTNIGMMGNNFPAPEAVGGSGAAGAKKGSEDEAIGRSRGGLSTKINISVDALGNPVRFILTAGQVHDIAKLKA
jgi:hypothetical protein